MRVYRLVILLCLFFSQLFVSCSEKETEIEVQSISLNERYIEMMLGETKTLTASVLPDDATNKTVTWRYPNNGVVKGKDGVITAIQIGEANVSAFAGDQKASCKVVVTGPSAYSGPLSFSEGVELMCLIYRLMGAEEYQNTIPVVSENIDSFFAPVINHEAIQIARQSRRYGVGYDAVTAYGLHLSISYKGEISFNRDLDGTDDSFGRWPDDLKVRMLTALNDFYQKSNFHEWYLSLEPLRQQAIDSFRQACFIDMRWYDCFFGQKESLSIQIILSFLIGMQNYGHSVDLSTGRTLLSPVMGSLRQDKSGRLYYGWEITDTLIHEFSHPYCNPLITEYWESMKDKAEAVYKKVEAQMKSMAYGSARVMMFETFVRASVIRYIITVRGDTNYEQLVRNEEKMGFLLVRSLVSALEMRQENQPQYPTMEDFMPELIKAINSYDTP